jgi:pimeloyl-ACP methyl ester carboxylesterase
MKARVDSLIQDVDTTPIPIVKGSQATFITAYDISVAFLIPLYAPLDFFDGLASLVADVLEGNYTTLLQQLGIPKQKDSCSSLQLPLRYTWGMDVSFSVFCGDGDDITQTNLSSFATYLHVLKQDSPTVGGIWAQHRLGCTGWKIRPKWRFTGPFTTPKADITLKKGHPAAPLLILSSKIDPVTPLANAFALSASHPDSAVLVQDSVGHCATSTPSRCTKRVIQEYLETGILPVNGTVCGADCRPWKSCAASSSKRSLDFHPLPL